MFPVRLHLRSQRPDPELETWGADGGRITYDAAGQLATDESGIKPPHSNLFHLRFSASQEVRTVLLRFDKGVRNIVKYTFDGSFAD